MNQTRISLLAVAASLFAVLPAHAQATTWVKFTSTASSLGPSLTSPTWGGAISPYSGGIGTFASPTTAVDLDCVDFFAHVTVGEEWNANITLLGAAAASPGTATAILANTRWDNLAIYEQAAWLTTQYAGDGGVAREADAIQTAIWWEEAFNGGSVANQTALNTANAYEDGTVSPVHPVAATACTSATSCLDNNVLDTQHWMDLAAYWAPRETASYYSSFEILSDVDDNVACVSGVPPAGHAHCATGTGAYAPAQEFMIAVSGGTSSTPEPGTMLLSATGLLAILGLGTASRRNRLTAFVRSFTRTA